MRGSKGEKGVREIGDLAQQNTLRVRLETGNYGAREHGGWGAREKKKQGRNKEL